MHCNSDYRHPVTLSTQKTVCKAQINQHFNVTLRSCFNNGLLACKVSVDDLEKLFDVLRKDPQAVFTVDLAARTICTGDMVVSFAIAPRHSRMLELGLDMVDTTLSEIDEVKRFREQHEREFPWMSGLPGKAKRIMVARGESLP